MRSPTGPIFPRRPFCFFPIRQKDHPTGHLSPAPEILVPGKQQFSAPRYHNYGHLLLVEEKGHLWLGVPGIYDPVKPEPPISSDFRSLHENTPPCWICQRMSETTAQTSDTGAVTLIRQSVPAAKMKCPDKHISNHPAKGFAYSIPFIC